MTTRNVIDPVRQQARRDLLAMVSIFVFVIPPALAGVYLSFRLYEVLFRSSFSYLSSVALLLMLCVGGVTGYLAGAIVADLIMKRFLTKEEMYKWALFGSYVPIITPITISLTTWTLGGLRPATTIDGLHAQLEGLGFYQYSDHPAIAKAKQEAKAGGSLYDLSTLRFYPLGEGAFAGGGLSDFFKKLRPFLDGEGISTNATNQTGNDGAITISIAGRCYLALSAGEKRAGHEFAYTLVRGFAIVNDVLRNAGSKERLYLVRRDGEPYAGFLTEDMYALLLESSMVKLNEKPVSASSLMSRLTTGY